MIVEYERGSELDTLYEDFPSAKPRTSTAVVPGQSESANFSLFVQNYQQLRDKTAHHQLKNDLIKHLWALKGSSE
jgi:hypothetical protein